MRLQFTEKGDDQFKVAVFLAKWWQILIFLIIAILLLLFFFPKTPLLLNITKQREADRIAKQYLSNLVALYPKKKNYNLLLIEQNVKFGELTKAASSIIRFLVKKPVTKADWKALLLYYKILRIETYAKPEIGYARRKGMDEMKNIIAILQKGSLNAEDSMEIAEDAINMNDTNAAMDIYQRMLVHPQRECNEKCVQSYASAAKFMLSHSMYDASAKLYFFAQANSSVLAEQRKYFFAALNSLQSGDRLSAAMVASAKHIGNLTNDKETLLFLSKLALKANKTNLAEKHVKRMLQLKVYSSSR